jgi:NDP-sugar pyrophosphorylase family protein
MIIALIMAGGRSERMRASSGSQHKALVRVQGLSLLERNLHMLLSHGFRDIFIAVSAHEPELQAYVANCGQRLVAARGAHLECLIEDVPLGTIGIARQLKAPAETILVINVDNLTALNLRQFVDHHLKAEAAFTIATHVEPFQIPFGEVIINYGLITEYREKPVRQIRVSSGTYVLAARACELINPIGPTSVPQLFAALRKQGERISAYEHAAPWIDVNDAAAIKKAEQMIADHASDFECRDEWFAAGGRP